MGYSVSMFVPADDLDLGQLNSDPANGPFVLKLVIV